MTKPKNAPLTARDVPEPLGVCDGCDATPALPEPGGTGYKCAACMAREVLQDAAQAQLTEMLAPLLGAWANHWQAAGLSPEALAGVLHTLADAWERTRRARLPYLPLIRVLLRYHRPPAYIDPGPARYTVRLAGLPMLTGISKPIPPEGWHAYHVRQPDGTPREMSRAPGFDLLTLELPDGSAALLPLGYRGALDLPGTLRAAVYIPAEQRQTARGLYFASHEAIPAEPSERGEVLA